jgi:hypothetical protein
MYLYSLQIKGDSNKKKNFRCILVWTSYSKKIRVPWATGWSYLSSHCIPYPLQFILHNHWFLRCCVIWATDLLWNKVHAYVISVILVCTPYQEGRVRDGEHFMSCQAFGFSPLEVPSVSWVKWHCIVTSVVPDIYLLFEFSATWKVTHELSVIFI